MTTHRARRLPRTVFLANALLAIFGVLPSVCLADELPAFRKGMWEFKRTVENDAAKKPMVMTTKQCTTPFADAKAERGKLEKAGCKVTPLKKSGNSYNFSTTCTVQNVPVESKSGITVASDRAYTIKIESRGGGRTTRELLEARRVGDC